MENIEYLFLGIIVIGLIPVLLIKFVSEDYLQENDKFLITYMFVYLTSIPLYVSRGFFEVPDSFFALIASILATIIMFLAWRIK